MNDSPRAIAQHYTKFFKDKPKERTLTEMLDEMEGKEDVKLEHKIEQHLNGPQQDPLRPELEVTAPTPGKK